jgi:hypothetical protein
MRKRRPCEVGTAATRDDGGNRLLPGRRRHERRATSRWLREL